LNTDQIISQINDSAGQDDRVVFVAGNFNVVHPGHLRLLRFAIECGDYLVVGVTCDGSEGVTIPEDMRVDGVDAIGFVNHAFILHESSESFISKLKPAVVVMGKEHENRENPEKGAVEAYGGKLLFGSGEVSFSSLELLHREYVEADYSTITKPVDYPARHSFTMNGLKDTLKKMVGLNVLVIGDLIVDEYVMCDALGMSQEDPTIVVTPIETKQFIGGAGIVAAHARGMGANVQYLSVVGHDDVALYAEEKLKSYGVDCQLYRDDSRPTTHKKRYRTAGKTMLRVSQLRQHRISEELASKIFTGAMDALTDCDVLIFSDFNYGCLPQTLVDKLIESAKERGVYMVADSQASSQMSDISRFVGMSLITPTEREARIAVQDAECGLAVLAQKLAEKSQTESIVITLGSEGMLVVSRTDEGDGWKSDNLPAFNTSVKDTAGAGDSFLTCTAMSLCMGESIWKSVYLGSIAAACQISRLGNTPLQQQDLIAEIDYN